MNTNNLKSLFANNLKSLFAKLVVIGLVGAAASVAQAGSYNVQVGYADNLRPSPFFPNPWAGGSGVGFFAGGTSTGYYDAGAIRIINTGSTAITFNSMTVDSFGTGASFNIWGSWAGYSIAAGNSAIFTQTTSYNFDTSDYEGSNPFALPQVHLTIDGIMTVHIDTAQVLNTGGTDALARAGLNESHQWRDIGTFGGQSGAVPESSSTLALVGLGLVGVLGISRRMRKA